jgi:ribosomal protein S27E
MMLKIACQQCGHSGIVNAETLPRSLTCSQCGSCRYVKGEDGTW